MNGITDIEYTCLKICQRRGKILQTIESVAAGWIITFGLATLTPLLPSVANTFYFIDELSLMPSGAVTGVPFLRITNHGGASAGNCDVEVVPYRGGGQNIYSQFKKVETDSMLYVVGSHSAGSLILHGTVFKITYVP